MDGIIVNFLLLSYSLLCRSELIEHIFGSNDIKEPLFRSAVPDFTRHVVVEPVIYNNNDKLVSTFRQGGHIKDIVIQFGGFGKNFIIDLKQNRNLFSENYVVKSSTKEGEEIYRPAKHKESHCFYHGSLRDHKHSSVALSTCDGINGYIYDGRESYHIEPAYDISSTSHRLYRDSDSVRRQFQCGAHPHGHSRNLNETRQILHKNEVLHRMRRDLRGPPDSNTNTRFVEMYLVVDYRTYDANGRNMPRIIRKTQNIANIVSMLYHPFNIYIALVGVEIMNVNDKFTITTEADSTLENFLHYRRSRINPYHPNDNAQLITDTTFAHGVVGKAIKGTICTFQYSGGVNLNLATEGQTAATIAHELGHNFGMDHDNYTYCQCKEDKCIMAATSGGINTPTQWSSCSMLALQEAFEMGMDYCLKNKPAKLLYGTKDCIESGQCPLAVCGNGFTEPGEECDCGLPEVCDTRCCNASTCKLVPGAQCATGLCCDLKTCQPKPAATMCRAPVGECDLPEFCWGNSQYCPDDVFLQDGVECYSGQSYCYKGKCRTHTGQCKLLWGTTGRVSDPVCFKHLNTNGSKHGNCGYNWTTEQYLPCLRDDVMCGLLHCVHQNEKLMFWRDNLAHATPATFLTIGPKTYICRGAMLDVGLDMEDPGMVPEGAKCEDRKMCINHRCTSISTMGFPSCPSGCSDRGVCNSKGHCHCEEGYAPPHCDEGGNGGSVDSGPIKIEESKGLLIGLLVFFLVVCPLLGLTAFLAYRFRVPLLAWWRQNMSSLKQKQTSQPGRIIHPPPPSHPPPKRDQPSAAAHHQPPPPYPGRTAPPSRDPVPTTTVAPGRPRPPVKAGHVAVVISGPTLTSSTNKDSQSHVQPSPKPPVKPMSMAPPRPPPSAPPAEEVTVSDPSLKLPTKAESKSRFGPIFKKPNLGKSQDNSSPKLGEKKQEVTEPEVVKRRELTREISNPVLISTTDRRSQHLVKLENLHVDNGANGVPVPPVPPKISLNRSESDFTKSKNKPLPPRPVSMPPSESGEEIEMEVRETRKAANLPQRPPPPVAKTTVDPDPPPSYRLAVTDTRQTIEDEISRLDEIKAEIPTDSADEGINIKPSAVKTEVKKPLKPKTQVKKSSSDSAKKPLTVTKKPATQSKSDTKPLTQSKLGSKPTSQAKSDTKPKGQWTPVDKPIFKPKDKPVTKKTSQTTPAKPDTSASKDKIPRKDSTDSLDDEGPSSVYARKKMFEGQKKPLLGAKSEPEKTGNVPQTPPKPGGKTGKQIRSVNV